MVVTLSRPWPFPAVKVDREQWQELSVGIGSPWEDPGPCHVIIFWVQFTVLSLLLTADHAGIKCGFLSRTQSSLILLHKRCDAR